MFNRILMNGCVLRRIAAAALTAATVFAGSNALAVEDSISCSAGLIYSNETVTVTEGNSENVYEVYYVNGVEYQRVLLSSTEIQQPAPAPVPEEPAAEAQQPAPVPAAEPEPVVEPAIGTKEKAANFQYKYVIECTATAYDPSPEENGGWGGMSATGVPLQPGIIAVDPRVIPLGSKVYVESLDGSWIYGYALAADTGGAIKGSRVDLLFLTKRECYDFGRRKCRVYVL